MYLRKIDVLVAEHVFHYTQEVGYSNTPKVWVNELGLDINLPHYSTNIKASWEVVKKVGTPWMLEEGRAWFGDHYAEADTTELAICLAALKAKGVEV